MAASQNGQALPESFEVRVLRQDGPGQPSYWERHRIRREPNMNVISVLQKLAAQAETVDGKKVAPVAWDSNCLEEVCGACTMNINGRVRQACSALVDNLLQDNASEIELQPTAKFPIIRDLLVDRSRLFRALTKLQAWAPVDGYYDLGAGPRMSQDDQEEIYPLSQCMSCGCCLEACPEYNKIELTQGENESDEAFEQRKTATHDQEFIGAHAISQVILHNTHPASSMHADDRLDALMQEGGIQRCGNAQNCVAVCPKDIPLTRSIAKAGRATTFRALRRFFEE